MDKGPSDFNDLHLEKGLQEVKRQIEAALSNGYRSPSAGEPDMPPAPPTDLYDEVPPSDDSPAPSQMARPSVESAVKRYAWCMPDGKIWDASQHKLLKVGAFKSYMGARNYQEWLDHKVRRTVLIDDVQPLIASAQTKGGGGLPKALGRYVYLNPSDSVWDRKERKLVPMSHLRYAIAKHFDDWIKHPKRSEIPADNLVFDPTQKCDPNTHINKFRGLAFPPAEQIDMNAFKNIHTMLTHLCNGEPLVVQWLVRWLAYPLQNVGAKMATAVLMHSDVHGSGKSLFFDGVMGEIYGEYSKTFGQQQLESQYNDWISETLFGVFEEVLSRSQRYSHTGTLKQMITGDKFYVEKKYLSGWIESNHMNCVFLSNEVQPLPVESSDRRFLVIWPEAKLLEELQAGVDEELRNGGVAHFYAWLLSLDLQNFGPHTKPPDTDAKKRLIDFGKASWEVFYEEWVTGDLDVPHSSCLVKDLFKVFKRWCSQRNEHCMGQSKFSGFLATKERRLRDVHFNNGKFRGKGVFFLVHECPEGKTQQEWLGDCVQEFDRVEQRVSQDAEH